MLLDVDPDSFVDAARRGAAATRLVASARAVLLGQLAKCSVFSGSDPGGRAWARSYDEAAADAIRLADTAIEAGGHLVAGLSITGLNYATAEHLNSGGAGVAPGHSVPILKTMTMTARTMSGA